ncbi:PEP-CTERM sorting domain-containing protein [Methylophaga sulfidovorans]|uniref:Thrombospondin C-terminal region n=1 Tax=Methylophaga sulfidovorans TaxID=45496 RepID=A0A1I4AH79_9GAMM|nr:PEP-CTERM sorting domain-containing protein [Methylophaga sulfidovorans]SFK55126.1 Thrombospondin C-terminal region [Methylophaga sulfidovorans]
MKKTLQNILFGSIILGAISTTAMAAPQPVDLSSWKANGNGNWVLQSGNNAVKQTLNNNPTVFHNNKNSQGTALSGQITVETTSDDDYIGFVLGYNNNDLTNSSADYLLIDWKQGNQNYNGTGKKGLAISQVSGVLGDNSGAWAHDPSNNVTELARATNLGDTGWVDYETYDFDITFTSSLVEVFVNGIKELSITGAFSNGSFGFYNYSQPNVLYAGIEEVTLPSAVPVPAAAFMFAPALLGFIGLRRKVK